MHHILKRRMNLDGSPIEQEGLKEGEFICQIPSLPAGSQSKPRGEWGGTSLRDSVDRLLNTVMVQFNAWVLIYLNVIHNITIYNDIFFIFFYGFKYKYIILCNLGRP